MATAAAPRTWESYVRDVGLRLQRERVAAGLSQEDLAHRSGMTRTHYQKIERGLWKPGQEANPSIKVLVRLAQQLGIEPAVFFPSVVELQWSE
jgi:transcriptional regulator with XRE-family HTH domain